MGHKTSPRRQAREAAAGRQEVGRGQKAETDRPQARKAKKTFRAK